MSKNNIYELEVKKQQRQEKEKIDKEIKDFEEQLIKDLKKDFWFNFWDQFWKYFFFVSLVLFVFWLITLW